MRNFTKSPFANEMLYIIAISTCTNLQTVIDMNNGLVEQATIKRKLNDFAKAGIISDNLFDKQHDFEIKLQKRGVMLIESKDKDASDFYMKFTQGNKRSQDEKHRGAGMRLADTHYMLSRAGVSIGTEKPNISAFEPSGKVQRLDKSLMTFYSMKEQRFDKNQKIGTAGKSLGSGLLITPELTGIVYRMKSPTARFQGKEEYNNIVRARNTIATIYRNHQVSIPEKSIVIGDGYDMALAVLTQERKKSNRRIACLADAIYDREGLHTDIIYIPFGLDGVDILKISTRFSRRQINNLVFSREEIMAANGRSCDAYIESADLDCYEFVTSDLTRLRRLKLFYFGDGNTPPRMESNLGFACLPSQAQFVRDYFGDRKVRLRIIPKDKQREYFQLRNM